MSKKLIAIWAEAHNHVIGKNQTMPWHLPAELAHFKATTIGSAILMGRVTFDGMKRRLLPGRETLILTRDKNFDCPEVTVVSSVEEALDWFSRQDKDLYIAGGAGVYKAFDGYYNRMIKTTIEADLAGDTYFPQLDFTGFEEVSRKTVQKDDKNAYDFTVITLDKKGD
ncbi:dihydrofolate reductase [Streptococcus dentiloxodontae]